MFYVIREQTTPECSVKDEQEDSRSRVWEVLLSKTCIIKTVLHTTVKENVSEEPAFLGCCLLKNMFA